MSDPELSPAEEARLRRLLAAARHTEPLPGDVAERLDAVLAALSSERAAEGAAQPTAGSPGPTSDGDRVVRLASRRRRRYAAGLVAAAAVVAVGVAVPRIDVGSGTAETSTADEAPAAEPPLAGELDPGDGDGDDPSTRSGATPGPDASEDSAGANLDYVRLRRAGLDDQLAALAGSDAADRGTACWDEAWGEGTRVPATYGGRDAVVVLREPSASHQRVELFVCGHREPVGSVRAPLP